MANTTEPFPLPPVMPEIDPSVPTIVPFPLPNSPDFASTTVNLISSTLSTTTVSRAARSTFSDAAATTASWTGPPKNSTDEIEWLLGGLDDWNVTFNSTSGNSTMEGSKNIFEERPWLMWLLIGIGILLIICVTIMILIWHFCKKKKDTQQERTPLAAVTPTSENRLKKWLPCCGKCLDRPTRNVADTKPPNHANLNPYKRPPLPPIGTSQSILAGEMDGYQGGHLPAHRLEPLKRHSTFDQFTTPQMLGANIQGLKGVPVMYVRTEDMRPLPQLD